MVLSNPKVVKCKPEFPYSEFKKSAMDLEYVINEADIMMKLMLLESCSILVNKKLVMLEISTLNVL